MRLARQVALLEHETLAALGVESGAASRITVPLAVNADSLATWFLPPLAGSRSGIRSSSTSTATTRTSPRPARVGHGHGRGHLAGDAVAGCRVSPLGAMRYEAVATPGSPHAGSPEA